MKTKIFTLTLVAFIFSAPIFAQDRTTVTATGSEISDNLDLRAVASIFGDSQNLEDFEQRLNDPKTQISNLDLNGDNQVDYLRVIESVEGYTHLVIVQAVLDRDVFQDVATIEVEKSNNQVQVQVVGNVFMYGQNYIYEPVYVTRPVIYNHFWVSNYRPYVSTWYWNYYPTYYYTWTPYPVFRYRKHIHVHINVHNHYNYVNTRRSQTAVALYGTRRANGYERQYPDRAFDRRNAQVANRYELDKTRGNSIRQNDYTTRNNTTRSNVQSTNAIRGNKIGTTNPDRIKPNSGVRAQQATRLNTASNSQITRENATVRSQNKVRQDQAQITRGNATVKPQNSIRSENTQINRGNLGVKSQNSVRQENTQMMPRGNNTRSATPMRTQTAAPIQNPVRTQSAPVGRNDASQRVTRSDNSESRNSSSRR